MPCSSGWWPQWWRRFGRPLLTAALLLAGALSLACGGSDTPTAPSPPVQPPPVADVHAIGQLSFVDCTLTACRFQGTIINGGPNCARDVRGITRILDAKGVELESQQWTIPNTMRQAEQVLYAGCCFTVAALNASGSTYRTEVFSTPLRCE